MKKLLSLFVIGSMLVLTSSCTKENLSKAKKELTSSNAKSQGTGGITNPPAAASGHEGGCPSHSSSGG